MWPDIDLVFMLLLKKREYERGCMDLHCDVGQSVLGQRAQCLERAGSVQQPAAKVDKRCLGPTCGFERYRCCSTGSCVGRMPSAQFYHLDRGGYMVLEG